MITAQLNVSAFFFCLGQREKTYQRYLLLLVCCFGPGPESKIVPEASWSMRDSLQRVNWESVFPKTTKLKEKIVVFCSATVLSWHQGRILSGWFISTCSLFQMGEFPERLILCFIGCFPPPSQHPCEPTYCCYRLSFASMMRLGLTPPYVYCKWVQIGEKKSSVVCCSGAPSPPMLCKDTDLRGWTCPPLKPRVCSAAHVLQSISLGSWCGAARRVTVLRGFYGKILACIRGCVAGWLRGCLHQNRCFVKRVFLLQCLDFHPHFTVVGSSW